MYVRFENQTWQVVKPNNISFEAFENWKKQQPNKEVVIKNALNYCKTVKISELVNYTIWRNTTKIDG